jgi:hypothetical protein
MSAVENASTINTLRTIVKDGKPFKKNLSMAENFALHDLCVDA